MGEAAQSAPSPRAIYVKDWRAKRRAQGIPTHSPAQMAKTRKWLAETYHALRAQLFEIVGKICRGCGHSDIRVLEFDHIHNDGAVDRKAFKGARSMLDYYVHHPEEATARLQPLCRNCNWLKRKGEPLPSSEAAP